MDDGKNLVLPLGHFVNTIRGIY